MSWHVNYTRRAHQDLRNLDRVIATRVIAAIQHLAEEGHGAVRRLRGQEQDYRLRVGDWRVRLTFDRESHTVTVLHIRHRSQAYRA